MHDFSMVGVDWLVRNVTYRPHCYMCFTDDSSIRFLFSTRLPSPLAHCSPWVLLETLRAKLRNTTDLDSRWRVQNSLPSFVSNMYLLGTLFIFRERQKM